MTEIRNEKLVKMTQEASLRASQALSKLSDEQVTVEVSNTEIVKIHREFLDIEPEAMVAGIYLPVTGDIKGAALLIFPEKIAYALCDVLLKRVPGTTCKLSELDKSALNEVGNIICGSFLTVFSNTLKIKIVENVPNFSFDMFGAVVDVIISDFAQKAEDSLVIDVKFVFEHTDIKGYVVLVFGMQEMKAIVKALELGGGLNSNNE